MQENEASRFMIIHAIDYDILLCKYRIFDTFPQHISTTQGNIFVVVAVDQTRQVKDRQIIYHFQNQTNIGCEEE